MTDAHDRDHARAGEGTGPDRVRRLVRPGVVGLGVAGLLLAGSSAGHAAGVDAPPVVLTGEPLVHTFDTRVPGDSVTGVWEVSSSSAARVAYDGVLLAERTVSGGLAGALAVSYGTLDDAGEVTWHDAGTLADPVTYTAAIPQVAAVVAAGGSAAIPVRVSLPDPSVLEGQVGELLSVEAAFTLSYLDPRDAPGSSGGYRSGVLAATGLAVTGLGVWPVAVAAGTLVGLGLLVRRTRRPA